MTPPPEVVHRFGEIAQRCIWHPLANAGGFSGAQIWRGEIAGVPQFALKCWPDDVSLPRLQLIHDWVKKAKLAPYVPKLTATPSRWTALKFEGRVWDMASWMPGVSAASPSELQLRAACKAICELHDVWKSVRLVLGRCPAVIRRLELFENWKPPIPKVAQVGVWREAKSCVRDGILAAHRELKPWLARPLPLQPCLTDIHRDHVLFTGDSVTGIIDYGAMKIDNVAVDAARYLGDATGEDDQLFEYGCDLFVQHHGEDHCPRELIALLDRTGTLGAIANWLLRDARTPGVEARLARLIERWNRISWRRP